MVQMFSLGTEDTEAIKIGSCLLRDYNTVSQTVPDHQLIHHPLISAAGIHGRAGRKVGRQESLTGNVAF